MRPSPDRALSSYRNPPSIQTKDRYPCRTRSYQTLVVRESGTVIFEMKDEAYTPFKEEDILIPVP